MTSPDRMTYHLVAEDYWRAQPEDQPYYPEHFAAEGFVHCTDGLDELVATGNRYYRADRRPYVALVIRVSKLTAELRYEDERRIFPHIYGPIDREAIVAVLPVSRAQDGTFLPFSARLPREP